MTAPRFHHPAPLPEQALVELPEAAAHHALRVLRLRHGQPIELFDGAGHAVAGTLHVEGRRAFARLATVQATPARRGHITLYQGIPAGDRMDWVVEKATEIGIHRIVPILARRTVVKLQGERRERRWQHWQKVALAACAQSGRNDLPEVTPPLAWADALADARTDDAAQLVCHPEATHTLATCLRRQPPARLALWVGPEGGWDDQELADARAAGVQSVRHGNLVLRSETAGLVLAAASAAVLGWMDD